jgi:hypothetical protein
MLNGRYYNNKLEVPVITIQKAKRGGNLGWFTLDPIWSDKNDENKKYEINISAEHLKDDVVEIVATLHHEMVHYLNKINDIKDCNGQVHNKKFLSAAESVGLVVEKSKKYGFGHTTCSDNLKYFIENEVKPNAECFMYFRNIILKDKEQKEKTQFTYQCPNCEEKIKAKAGKHIICGECNCDYEMEGE